MQSGSSGEARSGVGAADTRGKHRISAELKRLEQEIRFLESELPRKEDLGFFERELGIEPIRLLLRGGGEEGLGKLAGEEIVLQVEIAEGGEEVGREGAGEGVVAEAESLQIGHVGEGFGGSSLERPISGKWSSTAKELSEEQLTPGQAQGVGLERFQRRAEELEQLEKTENASAACKEMLINIETRPDPLLPETTGPVNSIWDRWFEGPPESSGCRCWIL
ncbi:hypothetical protein SASPL_116807 [Salvia splendens]|uniref:G protein gamma domain-containing protein n=1 Tax=Salvia splendens TaxID=180675 RepID=A0A8X8ZYB5_SALSN|nr:hypothetical protein SASPL_116807 [Salvia splendens]